METEAESFCFLVGMGGGGVCDSTQTGPKAVTFEWSYQKKRKKKKPEHIDSKLASVHLIGADVFYKIINQAIT